VADPGAGPIVVDEHDNIIIGRLRAELAAELGIRDLPRIRD
jgi:hypothetical protein